MKPLNRFKKVLGFGAFLLGFSMPIMVGFPLLHKSSGVHSPPQEKSSQPATITFTDDFVFRPRTNAPLPGFEAVVLADKSFLITNWGLTRMVWSSSGRRETTLHWAQDGIVYRDTVLKASGETIGVLIHQVGTIARTNGVPGPIIPLEGQGRPNP